jgi:DNA-binding PadR family transcriptional regulator
MSLAHAILSFLSDRACSGYDLAKNFDGSVGFFWNASHQQIYRELTKLESLGWLHYETVTQAGKPDKKLYRMTGVGRRELIDWICQPSELTPIKEELLVKIYAGDYVSPNVILKHLERHYHAHQQRLAIYQNIRQQYFQNPEALPKPFKFQYLTLLSGLHYEQGQVDWCEEAIAFLRTEVEKAQDRS